MTPGKKFSPKRNHKKSLRFEPLERREMLTTYYVDGLGGDGPGGSDSNNGLTENSAFATIQRAANSAQPGDIVQIRGGTYREQVSLLRSGTADNPIVFEAYNGENVTVTATDVLTGFTQTPETTDNNNVYVATLSGSTTNSLLNRHELTVFVNGQLVQEAKSLNSADYLRSSTWDHVDSSTGLTITDSRLQNVGDVTGGFVRVRTNDFTIVMQRIVAHNQTTGTITLANSVGNVNGRDYLVHDARSLVDSAGEWYFNEETNQFYLWAPGGGDPDNFTVEVKRRAEAFDLNGQDYIHFKNLKLTGGDFDASGSDGLLIEGVHVIASDRIFGPDFGTTRTALIIDGDDNVVRDSEFEQIWSAALRLRGNNNRIINNYFHDAAFNGGGSGGIATTSAGSRNLVSHNTFTRMGRSAIVGAARENIYQYNDFSEVALITEDTGAVYAFNTSYENSVFRFNTFHDINAKLSNGFYVDNFVTDVAFHNNITWNASAFGYKANQPNSFILHYNNTAYNSGRLDVAFPSFDSQYGSRFYNNIASTLDSDLTTGSDPTDSSNNFLSSSTNTFQDVGTDDFRLRASSGAVNAGREIPGITDGFAGAAPDAGAIELGTALFATGHDFDANPDPVYDLTEPLFGANLVKNASFERDFESYGTTGSPGIVSETASNLRSDGLNRYGKKGAVLDSGDTVRQTINGLKPDTIYTLGGWAKPIRQIIEAEAFGAGSTNTTLGNVRGQVTVGPLQNNDVLVYNNINFGDGSLYDELTLQIATSDSSDQVEVRLDSANGTLVDTINLPSNTGLVRSSEAADISGVTGTHSLYLVFKGGGGQLESLRFSNSNDQVELKASNHGGAEVSKQIGSRVYAGPTPRLAFRTGPSSTSAVISVTNPAGSGFDSYVDYLSLTEGSNGDPNVITVDLSQNIYDYDVGTPTSPVLGGFERISPETTGDVFWSGPVSSVDLGGSAGFNNANRDYVAGVDPTTLEHKVRNGIWRVVINMADSSDRDNLGVRAEGQLVTDNINFDGGDRIYVDEQGASLAFTSFDVTVSDGSLSLEFFNSDVGAEWLVNRIKLELVQALDRPEVEGDYNRDGIVNSADLELWSSTYSDSVPVPFAGADGSGSGKIDGADFLTWQRNFQTLQTFTVIDEVMGNGGLLSTTTASSDGQASTNFSGGLTTDNNGRALVSTGASGIFVDIPGWRAERISISGGNAAFGFDGVPSRLVGSEPAQYAFVNSGTMSLTSDVVAGSFTAGSVFDLSFVADMFAGTGSATATISFSNGESYTFDPLAVTTSAAEFADSYTLQNAATSLTVSIVTSTLTGGDGAPQLKLDGITLDVTTYSDPILGSASAKSALAADLDETAAAEAVAQESEIEATVNFSLAAYSPTGFGLQSVTAAADPVEAQIVLDSAFNNLSLESPLAASVTTLAEDNPGITDSQNKGVDAIDTALGELFESLL